MARYQLIIAYDGTGFNGYQRQKNLRTVQAEIENALRNLDWEDVSIVAAGRTDAGVHAHGQVVAFDLQWKHSDQKLANALNAMLPVDISVKNVRKTCSDFNPRYRAKSRTYRYALYVSPNRDALKDRFAWQIKKTLDISKMNKVGQMMTGIHDFSSFGSPLEEGGITIRQIHQAFWQAEDNDLFFWITANAFLYHMVRRTVKTMVAVGTGKMSLETVENHLQAKQPNENGGMIAGLAPSSGLSLFKVDYPKEIYQLD